MELQTERLRLVPCSRDFLSGRASTDYKLFHHIKAYLENLDQDPALLGWGVWLIITTENDQMVGDLGFKGKPVEREVELGYGILPHAQGNGYATEAVRELINWAFATEEVTTIKAECLTSNRASIRVLEKLNMVKTSEKAQFINWEIHY